MPKKSTASHCNWGRIVIRGGRTRVARMTRGKVVIMRRNVKLLCGYDGLEKHQTVNVDYWEWLSCISSVLRAFTVDHIWSVFEGYCHLILNLHITATVHFVMLAACPSANKVQAVYHCLHYTGQLHLVWQKCVFRLLTALAVVVFVQQHVEIWWCPEREWWRMDHGALQSPDHMSGMICHRLCVHHPPH